MRAHDKLKKAHEQAAANRFIKEYGSREDVQFVIRCRRERPDFRIENSQAGESTIIVED